MRGWRARKFLSPGVVAFGITAIIVLMIYPAPLPIGGPTMAGLVVAVAAAVALLIAWSGRTDILIPGVLVGGFAGVVVSLLVTFLLLQIAVTGSLSQKLPASQFVFWTLALSLAIGVPPTLVLLVMKGARRVWLSRLGAAS